MVLGKCVLSVGVDICSVLRVNHKLHLDMQCEYQFIVYVLVYTVVGIYMLI